MSDRRLRYCFKFLAFPLLVLLLVSCWLLYSMRVEAQVNQNSTVRGLQEQRLSILKELAKITSENYKTGLASFEELSSATKSRNEAELDLCVSNRERIAVFEKLVADAKLLEEQDAKLVANKLTPETSLLRAKADRLQQEILLEEARAK